MPSAPDVVIPAELLPADGRFCSGPSKVRQEAVDALAAAAPRYLGTSHRQAAVRDVVGRVREGVGEVLGLPGSYELLLGNGGATAFWDAAVFGLIDERSEHFVFGEFSSKFAAAAAAAPFLAEPRVVESPYGTHPPLESHGDCDLVALTHNETSTGVTMPVLRPPGALADTLVAVDATSAAGALRVDPAEFDVYYFSPQKVFASEGGLWLAACSPAALERIDRISGSDRWIPTSLDLATARDNSAKNQTYNTPPLSGLFLLADTVEWILGNGGLEWAAKRCETSAAILYGWAQERPFTEPFVKVPEQRSPTVATIDFAADVDAAAVAAVLRANGVLDTEPYRKLGRNQLRIAMFPAIEPDDVEALTRCIDHVVEVLA